MEFSVPTGDLESGNEAEELDPPLLLTVTNVSRSARKMETPRFPTAVSSLVSSFMSQEAILTETEAKFVFLSLFLRMSEHTAVVAALTS